MENIFGAVILYNPDRNYIDNIFSYLSFVEKLIVIDNSETPINIPASLIQKNIIIVQEASNTGIAKALNKAANIACTNQARWLLTMDQDSYFTTADINNYKNCFSGFDKERVAMFGVNYIKNSQNYNCSYVVTDDIITSGSIVNLTIMQQIGGFDENLFIDEVDSEYCFRAITKGFDTIRFDNIFLNHSLGKISSFRSLKSFKKTPRTLHSPLRIYYMVRNYFYVYEKYKTALPSSFPHLRIALLNHIKNNFLYGKNRWSLIKYVFLGYQHYKKNKMGKLNN